MDMQGSRVLNATQEQAWQALNDPDILKACIPGCDKFELAEPNVYAVGVALKIGPVAAKFTGKVSLMDIVPPNSYALQFEAQGGIAGFGKGESKVDLKPVDGGVELHRHADAMLAIHNLSRLEDLAQGISQLLKNRM